MTVKDAGRAARSARRAPAREPERQADSAELIQLLTPEGERVEHPDYPLEITAEEVKSLYRDLVIVRRIDFEAIALQRQGELGIWASLLGQEAAQVGSGRALGPRDMAFPTYREHGVAWCRGLDPMKLLELFRGVSHGGWDPKAHNFHLYTIVIGSQALHATGYAMGIQRDGAVGEDGEAVDRLLRRRRHQPGRRQRGLHLGVGDQRAGRVLLPEQPVGDLRAAGAAEPGTPLYLRAKGFGFPGVRVDGNDVLACLAVTRKAMQAASDGQGPTLIEAFTYRMGAHTTTDDPTRYRLSAELEAWKLKDPIERVKQYLIRAEQAEMSFFDEVEAEAAEVGARVRKACQDMAGPAAARPCSTTCSPARPRSLPPSGPSSPPTLTRSSRRRPRDDHAHPLQGHERGPAQGAGETTRRP